MAASSVSVESASWFEKLQYLFGIDYTQSYEEKKKEVDPTSKCYKLLVNNYVWTSDKDQFIKNYKEYSTFLDSIPKTDARYNDKVLQIQVLKDCEEDLKNLDNFYRKIKSRYSHSFFTKRH